MAIYSKDFAVCPWCDARTDSAVSHLYGSNRTTFGPWFCDACGRAFRGTVNAPGDVSIVRDDYREEVTRCMVLLKFDGNEGPVFFVIDHKRYNAELGLTEEDMQSRQRYFFEEHSCPTNFLDECVRVIRDGDDDPHGLMTFIRSVDVPRDFDAREAAWPDLFPEAFGDGLVIDGEARSVIRQIAFP